MPKSATSIPCSVMPDASATKILVALLRIPGLSGEENQVAAFIADALSEAGAEPSAIKIDRAHNRSVFGGLSGNLSLKLPGTVRGPRRLLIAHMDTVPICRGARPVKKGDQISSADNDTGLGGDNRTGVAVLLTTAAEILRKGVPHPPLTFLWTVQEEVGMYGARYASLGNLGKPKVAFNWDGGAANNIAIGSIGCYRMAVEIQGIATHAGLNPDGGVSAIGIASLAISNLIRDGWHGRVNKGRESGTCNVGVIDGGESTNVVTDYVHLRVEARSHKRSFLDRIVREVENAFTNACKEMKNNGGKTGAVTFDGRHDYDAFLLSEDEPTVREAAAAVESCGMTPNYVVSDGGLDANWISVRGIPTATLGCGQVNVHTSDEIIDLKEFHLARRVAMRLATNQVV